MRAIQALRVIFHYDLSSMPTHISEKIAALRDDLESPSVREIARQEQDTNSAAT